MLIIFIYNFPLCSILVFPSEFLSVYQGQRCIINSNNRLKEFKYLPVGVANATSALIRCKEHCARASDCWGCSTNYNESDRWTALSDCINRTEAPELINGNIVQKPSKT